MRNRWTSANDGRSASARALLPVLALASLLFLAACGGGTAPVSNPELDAVRVVLSEVGDGSNSLAREYEARLFDATERPVTDADSVKLVLTMTMRDGMQHKKEGELLPQPDGSYRAALKLPMEGAWKAVIRIRRNGYERTVTNFADSGGSHP